MKVFIQEEVLPFLLVSVTVVGLTVAFYGLPKAPLPKPAPAARFSPVTTKQTEDALVRAITVLRNARPAGQGLPPPAKPVGASATHVSAAVPSVAANGTAPVRGATFSPPLGAPVMPDTPSAPDPVNPATSVPVVSAVSSLAEAVKFIRAARTEEDFMRAEQQMHVVKTQLQAACTSGASSAFCDSAKEIDSLGF